MQGISDVGRAAPQLALSGVVGQVLAGILSRRASIPFLPCREPRIECIDGDSECCSKAAVPFRCSLEVSRSLQMQGGEFKARHGKADGKQRQNSRRGGKRQHEDACETRWTQKTRDDEQASRRRRTAPRGVRYLSLIQRPSFVQYVSSRMPDGVTWLVEDKNVVRCCRTARPISLLPPQGVCDVAVSYRASLVGRDVFSLIRPLFLEACSKVRTRDQCRRAGHQAPEDGRACA